MYIYLICFFTSCLFIKLSEKHFKSKLLHIFLVIVGLSIPCLLAGFRADTIGTDVNVYLKPLFECAKYSNDILNFLSMRVNSTRVVSDFEMGFVLLVYFITKVFGNLQVIFFFIESLIIIPIYKGLKKINLVEKNEIWLGMLIFYLMFFNTSLNLMRQFISIAIVFYGTSCLIGNVKKKTLKFFISIAIAYTFHSSALLGILIYLFYVIINNNKKIKLGKYCYSIKKLLLFIVSVLGIFLIANSNVIVDFLGNIGMEYYSRYVNGKVTFLVSSIMKNLPIVLMFIIFGKNFKNKYSNAYFYILIFIYSIIIEQFTTVNVYAARIALIFSMFNIVSLSELSCSYKNKKILITFLVCYLFTYWYYNFVFIGGSETIPYEAYWK